MTGKTHMAISAAAVAVALSLTDAGASGGKSCVPFFPCLAPLLPADPVAASGPSWAYAIAGLLMLGMVGGLFPDLDAPDTELQHLPRKAARHLGRYAAYITSGIPGMRRHTPLAGLLQGIVHLALFPFTLLVDAIGGALRAVTGHRGFTHSLAGALIFTASAAGAALIIAGSARWALAVGIVWLLGYSSHLAADACTPSGIPLLMFLKLPLKRSARLSWAEAQEAAPQLRVPDTPVRSSDSGERLSRQDLLAQRAIRYSGPPGHYGHYGHPGYGGAPMFHLLPKGMRISTGTLADTLLIRWIAWAVCAVAVLRMFAA
jgi:membrane-bound metal-dependent hydrolase YbcI (DUF457 family)